MRFFIISTRVFRQTVGDRRFFALSVVVPFVVIFLLKIFFDHLPQYPLKERYIVPLSAYVAHFFSFILALISLVQERTRGTMERIFVSGVDKWELILGYLVGFLFMATVQTFAVAFSLIFVFHLSYTTGKFVLLTFIIWILAIVSVALGLFISAFAHSESHVFPFIPLVSIPSFFFSGLLVDFGDLPLWAQWIGLLYPFHYAVNALLEMIRSNPDFQYIWMNIAFLTVYTVILIIVSSRTLRDVV